MTDFEKLGVFYLGRSYDLAKKKRGEDLVLYDSRDLVTHAVCVGMTGSGKTGLCLSLIEEAAIDGVPAILIDPKGDLCDLLLTFPGLSADEFRPWINEEDAARKGVSPDEYAKQQADLWRKGLAEWGQDGDRIRRLKDAAEFAIYTPGSSAGLPVSIVASFAAPPAAARDDEEALRERVASTATGLLTLLGISADPLKSREHILVSTILADAWSGGEDLTLEALIARIQTPGVKRIGVVDLEAFFPAKERFELAMSLNNLLAAPGFASWLEGDPLDVGRLLRTAAGKPRIAIFSIAHLSDAERMFFVTLLLNQTVAWMRTQSGTTSLRAILYMDEIAGYFPPVAAPPAKAPLLTLLKQGRAFGLGVVLATQNPVDLDYKGLSNTGTWLLGRLQTERDKARVLEGLEGAAAGAAKKFDRGRMGEVLAGLGNRVFLMNDVHEDEPVVFESRWAMSYLRGPLTRAQIKTLMDPMRGAASTEDRAPKASSAKREAKPGGGGSRPVLFELLRSDRPGAHPERHPDAEAADRLEQAGPFILYFGKLLRQKGVHLLLDAWRRLAPRYPDTSLVVVGFGSDRAWLESLAGERVIFTGAMDHAQLQQLVPCAELVVVPSVLPEAFGMVAAEAASCGLMTVVSDHSGLAEVAAGLGPASRTFDGSVDDLERAVGEILDLPAADREAIGLLGRERVCARWSWERIADSLISGTLPTRLR